MTQVNQYSLLEILTTMDIIKKYCIPILTVICMILLFVGCRRQHEEADNIFSYDSGIQVFFDDTSSGKLERTEILLNEDELKNLVSSLAAYSNKLSDDALKKEFLVWYTIRINDDITLQIDAEFDYSDSGDLTYMYVIQRSTDPATLLGAFIDSSIVEQIIEK